MTGRASSRGFTAIELSLVMSIVLVIIPLAYGAHLQYQGHLDHGRARVELAAQMRQLTREIRADRWQGRWRSEDDLALELPCGTVRYALEAGSLVRQAAPGCGATRTVARQIESIERAGSLIEVHLARKLRPGEATRVVLHMGVRP